MVFPSPSARPSRLPPLVLSLVLVLPALILLAGPARAAAVSVADLLDAKTEYQADFYLDTATQGSFRGTVIHAPGRDRRDYGTPQGPQSLLLRRDIDEATLLWPERKWYLTTSFTALAGLVGGFDGITLERRKIGSEVIAGEPCGRYEVTGRSADRGDFHGRVWTTADGILMKAVGTLRVSGRDLRVETGLLHLRRLRADPAAFLRPADYAGLPLDLSKWGLR